MRVVGEERVEEVRGGRRGEGEKGRGEEEDERRTVKMR